MFEWLSLSRIGLLYDIFGAVALAWGFLIIGPRDFRQATLNWRAKPEVEKLGYAKVDACFGVTLIALGFFGQLLGTDDRINQAFFRTGTVAPSVAIALLAIAVLVFAIYRGRLANRVIARSGIKDEDL